ncbi:hypothetical protein [Salibacterium lacus]|uniref:Uncharacterized protein n=1 Tax=Salibacterium lacus TaxID=1898109 RepID=A0ABW5T743_9BACI
MSFFMRHKGSPRQCPIAGESFADAESRTMGYVHGGFKPSKIGKHARSVCSVPPKTCERITGHHFWQQVTMKVLERNVT